MGKRTYQDNFRVVIEPRALGDFGFGSIADWSVEPDEAKRRREYEKRCQAIAASVRRHVDEIGSIRVASDTVQECEHCGARWTEDSPHYNGGCCDKDEGAHDAAIEHAESVAQDRRDGHG